MLDNVSVTPEELADAMKAGNAAQSQEEIYEDAYSNGPSQQQTQQQQYQQQPPQQQQQQQQFRQSSPVREVCNHLCYAIKSVILGQNFENAKKKFFKCIWDQFNNIENHFIKTISNFSNISPLLIQIDQTITLNTQQNLNIQKTKLIQTRKWTNQVKSSSKSREYWR